jgi:hypothetical protein
MVKVSQIALVITCASILGSMGKSRPCRRLGLKSAEGHKHLPYLQRDASKIGILLPLFIGGVGMIWIVKRAIASITFTAIGGSKRTASNLTI